MPQKNKRKVNKGKSGARNKNGEKQNFFVRMKDRFVESLQDGTSLKRIWRILRPITIYAVSIALIVALAVTAVTTVNNMFFAPVDPNDDTPMMLVVGNGSSMAAVANKLQNMGLINSKWGIKLLADFTNRSGKVKAGEYILDKTMSASEILDLLTQPSEVKYTAKVTITEGMKLEEIAELLVNKGIITDANSFIAECNDLTKFEDLSFISQLKGRTGVRYALEGYLFPDTYEFYLDSTNQAVIRRMLSRFGQIYTEEYAQKAQEMGMTMNQIISLASIVQSEGLSKDFAKVSAVFQNRLNVDMTLSTDVCIQYAINKRKLVLTQEELNVNSPYNLHKNKGLPPGPICSPGKQAIEAVLNPDGNIITGNYLYFTLTDPATGELAFSKTYEEHQKVVDKWRPVWEEYDRTH